MTDKKGDFKKIFLLGIPLFAGNFSKYLLQLADTVMVGRLGTLELASIAIAGLYCHVLLTFIWPLTSGVQAITARRFGKQKLSKNSKTGCACKNGLQDNAENTSISAEINENEVITAGNSSADSVTNSGTVSSVSDRKLSGGQMPSESLSAEEIFFIHDSDGESIHSDHGRICPGADEKPGYRNIPASELSPEAFTGRVLTGGFAAGAAAGLAAFIISFASSFILDVLIDEKSLLPLALEYTYLLRWAFPIAGLGVVISGFLAGINMTFQIMVVTIGSNILNIFFNYLFIFGSLGFPRLGVQGAALGTVLAEVLGTLYLLLYLLHEKKLLPYRIFSFSRIKLNLVKDIIRIASPIAVQNIVALTVFLVYESFIGIIGTAYLAATHIIFSVFRVNKTIVGGFARAGGILTGNFLGADDKIKAESIVKCCAASGFLIGVFIVITVFAFPSQIASFFTKDTETAQITVKALRFFALFFFVEVFGYTFEIIFAGIGWSRFVLFSEFTTNMIFILFMTWLCIRVLGLGIYWGWLSFALYQVFHALILTAGWLSKRWLYVEVEKK